MHVSDTAKNPSGTEHLPLLVYVSTLFKEFGLTDRYSLKHVVVLSGVQSKDTL